MINLGLKVGGRQVSEENYQARLEACAGCQFAGTVEIPIPLKTLQMDGCTRCGCPFETKPRWETYWSFTKLKFVTATCPHPEGNKWDPVDALFV